MKKIKYIKGDATNPSTAGTQIIARICNDMGGWGKGFVLAISKRWRKPENDYRDWYKSGTHFNLGEIQMVQVEEDLWICNMIGQHKTATTSNGIPPIRYEAVESCLKKLADEALSLKASIHMPRIGCSLAGGKWEEIEPIIQSALLENGIEVYVYDLNRL
ncbi:macro domain-containing protein [uncultured Chryseobacterium sp.]|uniref:macro domain-containing protein n=1 Tax=uncultured Chryseobacterium sp. TaxID=259322 RepID=UPI0025F9D2CF|nr:macro domain-containing protein [uncultured Chryseobacterium sp.]